MSCTHCNDPACTQRHSTHCIDYQGKPLKGIEDIKQLSVIIEKIHTRLFVDMDLSEVESECVPVPESQRGFRPYFVELLNAICDIKNNVTQITIQLEGEQDTDNSGIEELILQIDQLTDQIDQIDTQLRQDIAIYQQETNQIISELQNRATIPVGACLFTHRIDKFDTSTGRGINEFVGWAMMDGRNGTKDWSGKFMVNYDATKQATPVNATDQTENYGKVGNTGGKNSVKLTSNESGLPAHAHQYSDEARNDGNAGGNLGGRGGTTKTTTKTTANSSALDAVSAHENRPAYVVALWIEYVGS